MTSSSVFRLGLMPVAIAFALTCIHAPAGATDKSEAEGLVVKSLATVQALSKDSDFAAMKSSLAQARAIIVFPRVVKAGFVLGGSGGSGVLLARDADTGTWAGPAFYTLRSASLGLQAGASSAEMVMVVNSQKALDSLYTNKLKLGAEATVVLGPKGVAKGGPLGADFVVYSKVKGAFAGVSVDGSVLDVRQSLNTAFYGKRATPTDILVKRDISSPEADPLRVAVADAAK